VTAGFTWRDGERLIRFGPGVAGEAARLVTEAGFTRYALLSTERALVDAPHGLREGAEVVLLVPPGRVDEISAELLGAAGGRPLVAYGGGRVIDAAKAIAGAPPQGSRGAEGGPRGGGAGRRGEGGGRCAAIPTTLSGAPMTPFHRTPAAVEGARRVRPALVVADPDLMASQPPTMLAATAMNALAHAMESLYTPLANPVSELAALRAASLIAGRLPEAEPRREELGLASILAGYAVGATGLAVHHAVCQTIVRIARSPHAETNSVMLPHSARLMANRAPAQLGALAEALGDPAGDPEAAAGLISKLAARSGHTRLSTLGVTEDHLPQIVDSAQGHRGIEATPAPPDRDELLDLLRAAL
jgi:alcohol dehydrogenase class IV